MNKIIKVLEPALLVALFIALVVLITPVRSQITPTTLGYPSISSVGTCNLVDAVTEVTHLTAGHVQTDDMAVGFGAGTAHAVTTSAVTSIGALPAGTKSVEVKSTGIVNYGDTSIVTGTGHMCLAANERVIWNVTTTTPNINFIGCTSSVTVCVNPRK